MTYRLIKDLIAYKIKFGSGFEKELRKIIDLNTCSEAEIIGFKREGNCKTISKCF